MILIDKDNCYGDLSAIVVRIRSKWISGIANQLEGLLKKEKCRIYLSNMKEYLTCC